jgi:hypothetical protein
MRNPVRASLVVASLAVSGVLLAACTPSAPVTQETKTPLPSPSVTPIFASDAEALAAAVAVYKKFEAVSDAVGQDGGAHPERIKPYVNDMGYAFELRSFQKLQSDHAHQTGFTRLNNAVFQSRDEVDGWATVTLYTCEDISEVDRIGPDGRSMISADRADFIKYQAVLQGRSADSLAIVSNDYWSGDDICKR